MKNLFNSRTGILAGLALLCGCGDTPTEAGPGGVSADDARQLDEAAAKLDAETLPASERGDQKSQN